MGRNTYKKPIKSSREQKKSRFNPFAFIEQKFDISGIVGENVPIKLVLPLLYTSLLALVYIWSNYKAGSTIRKIDRLQQEVEDLRADVTTLEAEYMYASKQSEVVKKIQPLGIIEIEEPPQKLILEE